MTKKWGLLVVSFLSNNAMIEQQENVLARRIPRMNDLYEDYKGIKYQVLAFSCSVNGQYEVFYKQSGDASYDINCCSLEKFNEIKVWNKGEKPRLRFKLIDA